MKLPIAALCTVCMGRIEPGEECVRVIRKDGWVTYYHASHDSGRGTYLDFSSVDKVFEGPETIPRAGGDNRCR